MPMLRLLKILAIFSIAAALVGCGVGEARDSAPAAAAAVPVDTARPARGDVVATYGVTTTIGSEGDAPVVARAGGELVELLVEEGERVVAGQVLARLDGERQRLEMLAARADLDRARGEFDRYLGLYRRGLVSEAMFESLRYDLEALEAAYELQKLDYDYTRIRATIDGIVSERHVKPGQAIRVGDPLFRITDTSQLVAHLNIPQTELGKFRAGHVAALTVDAMPDRSFTAEIVRISPTIDREKGTFRATALIENDDRLLAPGMFARLSIAYEKHADVMTIPASALLEDDDETAVFVVEDGIASRRVISTGVVSGSVVEIVGGLGNDDVIVVTGHGALRDGSRVLMQNDKTAALSG